MSEISIGELFYKDAKCELRFLAMKVPEKGPGGVERPQGLVLLAVSAGGPRVMAHYTLVHESEVLSPQEVATMETQAQDIVAANPTSEPAGDLPVPPIFVAFEPEADNCPCPGCTRRRADERKHAN